MVISPDVIRRVCVLGGGPSGVAAAKCLIAENHFTTVDVFEQRSKVGGVWNINSRNVQPTPIPSTDPFWGLDKGAESTVTAEVSDIESNPGQRGRNDIVFDSPLYPTLETNIPHQIMAYSTLPFTPSTTLDAPSRSTTPSTKSPSSESPRSSSTEETENSHSQPHIPLFPHHPTVLSYLSEYATPVLPHIHFSTQITSITPLTPTFPATKWSVHTLHLPTSTSTTRTYDAVIIANGHYTVPYLPSIPGIQGWNSKYPNSISHSRDFRDMEAFGDKKVVVVGGSASGLDIGMQIERVAKKPVIRVLRSSGGKGIGREGKVYTGIEEFVVPGSEANGKKSVDGRAVRFTTTDPVTGHSQGIIERDIDIVLFATGYLYTFPFFPSSIQSDLISQTSGQSVHGLYRQLLMIKHPTIAFMVLPLKVVPFPLAEAQASVVARVWSGRLGLPSVEEMEADEMETRRVRGNGKRFHTLEWPRDVDYYNLMLEWAEEGSSEKERDGLEERKWGDDIRWLRSQSAEIRKRYIARGEDRKEVKRWEELGVDYGKWKDEQSKEAKETGSAP